MTTTADSTCPAPQTPLLIAAEEVARRLDISARTVWRLHSAGKLPRPVPVGGSKRWRADEIHRWVDARCPPRTAWETQNKRA